MTPRAVVVVVVIASAVVGNLEHAAGVEGPAPRAPAVQLGDWAHFMLAGRTVHASQSTSTVPSAASSKKTGTK